MFRGNHPARVDEKGRLKLPADFKRVVEEKGYGDRFYITSRDGKRAEVYPLPEWEAFEERLGKIPDMNPAKKKLVESLMYFGGDAELDSQGRLLIPQKLRAKANLVGDVAVLGWQKFLQVANDESVRQEMESNPLTVEDQQALADLGL